jgi:ELWxxDGT repeat protein
VSDGTAANTVAIVDEATDLPIEHGTSALYDNERPYVLAAGKVYFMGDNDKVYEVNGNKAKAIADLSDLSDGLAYSSGSRQIASSGTIATDGTSLYFNIGFGQNNFAKQADNGKISGTSYQYILHRINSSLTTAHKLERLEKPTSNVIVKADDNDGIKASAVGPQTVVIDGFVNRIFSLNGTSYFAMNSGVYSMTGELSSIALVADTSSLNGILSAVLDDGTVMVYEEYSPYGFYKLSSTGITQLTLTSNTISGFQAGYLQTNTVFAGKDKLYVRYGSGTPFSLVAIEKDGDVNSVEYGAKISALDTDSRKITTIGSITNKQKAIKFSTGIAFEVDNDEVGKELWAINYATGKVDLLEDLNSSSTGADAAPVIHGVLDDATNVIFSADSGTSSGSAAVTDTGTGRELWVSAGVAGDPSLVKDIADGSSNGVGVVSNQMVIK